MSDVHNWHNCRPKCDTIDMRSVISENWVVDRYGFPDVRYVVDCCFKYGVEQTRQVMGTKHNFCIICKYPDDVVVDDDN